jgi:hypothetical protein
MQSQQLRAWKLGFTTLHGFSRLKSHHIITSNEMCSIILPLVSIWSIRIATFGGYISKSTSLHGPWTHLTNWVMLWKRICTQQYQHTYSGYMNGWTFMWIKFNSTKISLVWWNFYYKRCQIFLTSLWTELNYFRWFWKIMFQLLGVIVMAHKILRNWWRKTPSPCARRKFNHVIP